MTGDLKAYIRLEAMVSAAFNFFINGMLAALIYHNADVVPTNIVSIPIDLLLTCWLMFILSAYFCRASLRRSNTLGILETKSKLLRGVSRMLVHPLLYGLALGTLAAIVLSLLAVPFFMLLGVYALPFYAYAASKAVFAALLGGGATVFTLSAGIRRR